MFVPGCVEGLEVRAIPLAEATDGHFELLLSRARQPLTAPVAQVGHTAARLYYVLNGEIEFDTGERGVQTLIPGDCVYLPAGRVGGGLYRATDSVLLEFWARQPPADGLGGEHTVSVVRAAETGYTAHSLRPWLRRRDLGVAEASRGWLHVGLSVCAQPYPGPAGPHWHSFALHVMMIVQGFCQIEYAHLGAVTLIPGDCVYQPAGVEHDVVMRSDDCEILEIIAPHPD